MGLTNSDVRLHLLLDVTNYPETICVTPGTVRVENCKCTQWSGWWAPTLVARDFLDYTLSEDPGSHFPMIDCDLRFTHGVRSKEVLAYACEVIILAINTHVSFVLPKGCRSPKFGNVTSAHASSLLFTAPNELGKNENTFGLLGKLNSRDCWIAYWSFESVMIRANEQKVIWLAGTSFSTIAVWPE